MASRSLPPVHRLAAVVVAASLLFPSTALAEGPPTRMYSPWLLGGGIALSALGGLGFAAGWFTYGRRDGVNYCATAPCDQPDREKLTYQGIGAMGLGAAAFAGGVAMIVIGVRRVPVTVSALGPRGAPGASLSLSF